MISLLQQGAQRVSLARKLRKRMTPAEKVLWEVIRNRKIGCKYRRQVPIGTFIGDFCCAEHRMIIEIDGSSHTEKLDQDKNRDMLIQETGFRVLRFSNDDVLKRLSSVLERIELECTSSPLTT